MLFASDTIGFLNFTRLWKFGVLILIYGLVVYGLGRPASVSVDGWRLTGIFLATVAGLMLQPIAGGALVLIAITLLPLLTKTTPQVALAGYADPTNWLVLAAFFISRSLINTGLARRIALGFVRTFGQSSLGISYALTLTDTLLATIIPSNGARAGGVTLPICRSIAELYGSKPGASAALLGTFLMAAVYQGVCVSSAMFYTGQASNPLAAKIATEFGGVSVTWLSWFVAASVPGICSLIIVPWLVFKILRPQVQKTPEAAAFAAKELQEMGGMSANEKILTAVFVCVCGLWITTEWHKLDVAISALLGAAALLLTGVLTWEDVKSERSAWDIFIWYGGLLQLGKLLNGTGVTKVFAQQVSGIFDTQNWWLIFLPALLIYFYAHYGFASITAHLLAMYPAFLAVLTAKGAPLGLLVYSFACFANLSAGLTNYGTTPAPMFFAQDYVTFRDWWRVGFVVSLANLAIWGTIGFGWWKILGLW